MSMDGIEIATVTIRRVLSEDDLIDHVIAADGEGNELPLAEALGMMRLAEHTLIESRMSDDDEEQP